LKQILHGLKKALAKIWLNGTTETVEEIKHSGRKGKISLLLQHHCGSNCALTNYSKSDVLDKTFR